MELTVVGFNFKTSTLQDRERWILQDSDIPNFLQCIVRLSGVEGAVYLATCNRVEIYACLKRGAHPISLIDYWKNRLSLDDKETLPAYVYKGDEAYAHLLKVAVGLDSLALGEPQVLGQVKEAYAQALELKVTGPLLNFIFQQTFRVAKQIRTEIGIGKYPVSIASIALMLAEQIFGDFTDTEALVVGLGEMGMQTADLLSKRGVGKLVVTNRTEAKAKDFASRVGAEVHPFENLQEALSRADLVITCTASPVPVLTKEMFLGNKFVMRQRPTILIDLGVPRDIEPAVSNLNGVYLYNVDDLKTIADKNLAVRQKEAKLALEKIGTVARTFEDVWGKKVEWNRRACSSAG
ncbi:MAG: glutamyl-tRNA reductase [Deltaproteobacteria bacterium]|nr:glutamyl-tRNA reductase [Deltaproteobacteria bacterium]